MKNSVQPSTKYNAGHSGAVRCIEVQCRKVQKSAKRCIVEQFSGLLNVSVCVRIRHAVLCHAVHSLLCNVAHRPTPAGVH